MGREALEQGRGASVRRDPTRPPRKSCYRAAEMSRRRQLLSVAAGAIAFSFFFLFGAVAVDPLPVYRAIQEKRLSLAGARREVFAADDGTSLSAFVLGPLSAERPVVLLHGLSLIHISEPTRRTPISYAV